MARRKITDGLTVKANGTYEKVARINGKLRSFSSKNPEEVWRKYYAALDETEEDEAARDKGPLFETLADEYEEIVLGMKQGTQKAYLPAIRRARAFFQGKRMREIQPYMILDFLRSVPSQAHTTISNHKTVVNSIFQIWVESKEGVNKVNTAKLATMPRGLKKGKRQPPTEDQVQIVKEHYRDPDALPAVVFLCTGERRGEACAIQVKDIDFEKKVIHIQKAVEHINNIPHIKGTKTDAGYRQVPLLRMLEEALDPFRFMPKDTYILSGTDKPLTASQYNRRWTAFWRKHGQAHPVIRTKQRTRDGITTTVRYTDWAADVCAHQFRHEFVCMLCMAEVPEEVAVQLVGHANMKMIHEVYMALKPQMIQTAADRLNALLSR